jgi:phosphate starvation-inducible protein PhoH
MGKYNRAANINGVKKKMKGDFLINQPFEFTEKQTEVIDTIMDENTKCIFINGSAGTGKAQPLDVDIITPTGKTKLGDLRIGDYVIGSDGKPKKILNIFYKGIRDIYKVEFSDKSSTQCCDEHLWHTFTAKDRDTKSSGSTKELSEIRKSIRGRTDNSLNHSIPLTKPVEFENRPVYIDPYIMGILIGDGGLTQHITFTSADIEIVEEIKKNLPLYYTVNTNRDDGISYSIVYEKQGNPMLSILRAYNLCTKSEFKYIPDDYIFNSIEKRIALLQGLLDSDGHCGKNKNSSYIEYSTSSNMLADNIKFLVESLGGTAVINKKKTSYKISQGDTRNYLDSYRIYINLENIQCFRLSRKLINVKPRKKYFPRRYITNITPIGSKESACLLIDAEDHLYLTDNCIVTHNTHLAVFSALQHLQLKLVDRLIYVRGMVESANSKLGFLPGDQKAKTDVYFEVMRAKLEEMLTHNEIGSLEADEKIQAMPISFLRGRDFKHSIVIVDEAQCLYFEELETIISRIGEDSKIIFLFDPDQSDIVNAKHRRDIVKFAKIFNTPEADQFGIAYREFTEDDIMRSEFCKFVMKAIKKYKMFDAA